MFSLTEIHRHKPHTLRLSLDHHEENGFMSLQPEVPISLYSVITDPLFDIYSAMAMKSLQSQTHSNQWLSFCPHPTPHSWQKGVSPPGPICKNDMMATNWLLKEKGLS